MHRYTTSNVSSGETSRCHIAVICRLAERPARGCAGEDVSPWHDIPLHGENGTFNFVCEIPKETAAKMEVATVGCAPSHNSSVSPDAAVSHHA